MPIIINSNLPAMRAQNSLTRASWSLNRSLERLTTGNRINSAADDPAGYYYASGLSTQLRGTQIAYQNVATGNDMINIAVGDLTAINDQLERIKELATEYSSDTLTDEQKTALKEEVQQRVDEIERIAEDSEFNKVKLLDGSKDGMRLQIGANSDPATNAIYIEGVFLDASTGQDGIKLFGGSGTGQFADVDAAFQDAESAAEFIDTVQAAADTVTDRISKAGAYQARLESISDNILTKNENLTSAYSTVMDTDIAAETSNYIRNQILQQTATSLLSQANQIPGVLALNLINNM